MTQAANHRGLREAHKERTRAALVDVALRQFADRGYHAVTVEDICVEAGVSPRTFFRYFTAKEHVLAAPVTTMLGVIRTALPAQPDSASTWTALRNALLEAADHVDARAEVFLRAGRVIRANPGALASSAEAMMSWEQGMREEIDQRLGAPKGSLYPGLLLGTAMTAFRVALDRWQEDDAERPVRALVAEALDAVAPGARSLQRAARDQRN